jgi:hypothetical protein
LHAHDCGAGDGIDDEDSCVGRIQLKKAGLDRRGINPESQRLR